MSYYQVECIDRFPVSTRDERRGSPLASLAPAPAARNTDREARRPLRRRRASLRWQKPEGACGPCGPLPDGAALKAGFPPAASSPHCSRRRKPAPIRAPAAAASGRCARLLLMGCPGAAGSGRCSPVLLREPVSGGASRVLCCLVRFFALVGLAPAWPGRLGPVPVRPSGPRLVGFSASGLRRVAPFCHAPLVVVRSPLPLPPPVPVLVRLGAVRRVGARSRAPLGVGRVRRVALFALLARLGALRLPAASRAWFLARVPARPVRCPPPSGAGVVYSA